jgi:hypothetical protein
MTHLTNLLKNKLLLQKNFHTQEIAMDEWPFWMFEENIKIVNQLSQEEEETRNKLNEEKFGTSQIKLK